MPDTHRHHRHHLTAWREHRGYTQGQVIERLASFDDPKLPKTEASLSRVENYKQALTERLLYALADVYDVEPGDLIDRDPSKEGQIIDLLRLLNDHQRKQAAAVIEGLLKAG